MGFDHIINLLKDTAQQIVCDWVVRKYSLEQFGKVNSLRLDTVKRTISIELDFYGEVSPIEVTIKYQMLGPIILEIGDMHASREWMSALFRMIPADKKLIEVPRNVGTALTTIVSSIVK